jgi:hypothetical protein
MSKGNAVYAGCYENKKQKPSTDAQGGVVVQANGNGAGTH